MMNAKQTIAQLGGMGKLKAMVNARDFVKGENSLTFKFSGSRKTNGVAIHLTPSDEYELRFLKFGTKYIREVERVDAWAGNLQEVFEDFTGLYLSM